MEQLYEPIEVNKKFIKMIENEIQPEYEKIYETLFQLIKDIIINSHKEIKS